MTGLGSGSCAAAVAARRPGGARRRAGCGGGDPTPLVARVHNGARHDRAGARAGAARRSRSRTARRCRSASATPIDDAELQSVGRDAARAAADGSRARRARRPRPRCARLPDRRDAARRRSAPTASTPSSRAASRAAGGRDAARASRPALRARHAGRRGDRMKLRLYHHPDGARVAYREAGTGPGARAAALGAPQPPRVGAGRRGPRTASASCCPTCRCTATPRTARATPTRRLVRRGHRRLLPRACGPRPLVGGHDLGAELAAARGRAARSSPAARADAQPRCTAPPERAARAGVARDARAAAVPGLDRVARRGARLVFRPDLGEKLARAANPAARDLVRHAFADVGGNADRARSWARFARGWPRAGRELLDAYARVTAPTLLLWADADPLYPLAAAEEALDLLPDAQLRVLHRDRLPDRLRRPRRRGARARGVLRITAGVAWACRQRRRAVGR